MWINLNQISSYSQIVCFFMISAPAHLRISSFSFYFYSLFGADAGIVVKIVCVGDVSRWKWNLQNITSSWWYPLHSSCHHQQLRIPPPSSCHHKQLVVSSAFFLPPQAAGDIIGSPLATSSSRWYPRHLSCNHQQLWISSAIFLPPSAACGILCISCHH